MPIAMTLETTNLVLAALGGLGVGFVLMVATAWMNHQLLQRLQGDHQRMAQELHILHGLFERGLTELEAFMHQQQDANYRLRQDVVAQATTPPVLPTEGRGPPVAGSSQP